MSYLDSAKVLRTKSYTVINLIRYGYTLELTLQADKVLASPDDRVRVQSEGVFGDDSEFPRSELPLRLIMYWKMCSILEMREQLFEKCINEFGSRRLQDSVALVPSPMRGLEFCLSVGVIFNRAHECVAKIELLPITRLQFSDEHVQLLASLSELYTFLLSRFGAFPGLKMIMERIRQLD